MYYIVFTFDADDDGHHHHQGPKCGRGGRGKPPTTRIAESKVGFFGGWATKSWVFGLVFFVSWLGQRRTTNDFRIDNKKSYLFLMNNPIATSFNKLSSMKN